MLDNKTISNFAMLGFLGYLGLEALQLVVLFLRVLGANLYKISNAIAVFQLLALVAIAGLYGLKFLMDKNIMTAALAGTIGIAGLYGLCSILFHFSLSRTVILAMLVSAVCTAYYLVYALILKDKNPMIFLLCGCAFLYNTLLPLFTNIIYNIRFFRKISGFLNLIFACGYVVCAGIAFLACKTANETEA